MSSYALTLAADVDLEALWQYVAASSGETAADRLEAELHAAMHRAAEFPGIGHSRHDLGDAELRVIGVHRILIIYRAFDGSIEVIRVIHGARDVGAIFGTGPID